MINFISILKCGSGTAAYHVQAVTDENYQARLINSTSDKSVPKEISIESKLFLKHGGTMADTLANKLMSAIQANKMIEAHAGDGNYIN